MKYHGVSSARGSMWTEELIARELDAQRHGGHSPRGRLATPGVKKLQRSLVSSTREDRLSLWIAVAGTLARGKQ